MMANKRAYPTIQRMMNDLIGGLATGKNHAKVSRRTMLGSHKILETTISSILEAIESITKSGCRCPVCAGSLACLNQLENSTSRFKDNTATTTNNLIEAAWFLGNVSSIAVCTSSNLAHIRYLVEAAHIGNLGHVAHLITFAARVASDARTVSVEHLEPEDPKDKPN
jgi:hypothetical protein